MTTIAATKRLAMTEQQRRQFDEQGYLILEDFLSRAEIDRLLAAFDEVAGRIRADRGLGEDRPFTITNALAHHDAFLDLVDDPRMLAYVIDAIGWNIQVRTSFIDYRPPYAQGVTPGELGRGLGTDLAAGYHSLDWHADLCEHPYALEAVALDGRVPAIDVKASYYLTDLTPHNSGAIALVPGSHKRPVQELRDRDHRIDPREVVEINVRPGAAMVWSTAVWHCVTPNLSERARKVFYVGYTYRWVRPTDYIEQDPALVARSSPIRRQLLGAMATDEDPLGRNALWYPESQHWVTRIWKNVPLKAWAEERVGRVE
jgi:ectoine hydroxylase